MPGGPRIGTAGWSIPKAHAGAFVHGGSHLQRYASGFNAVEINSSFYRPHRRASYERWAASVPHGFRFAVKVPRSITHERRLKGAGDLVDRFLSEIAGLGEKLGPLLVQLPPSLRYEEGVSDVFLADLRSRVEGDIACEPRHVSWFQPRPDVTLAELCIARVAADPAPAPGAGEPSGWRELAYYRLHGSPRMYYSPYGAEQLADVGGRLRQHTARGVRCWCIFDNTAEFAATADALSTVRALAAS